MTTTTFVLKTGQKNVSNIIWQHQSACLLLIRKKHLCCMLSFTALCHCFPPTASTRHTRHKGKHCPTGLLPGHQHRVTAQSLSHFQHIPLFHPLTCSGSTSVLAIDVKMLTFTGHYIPVLKQRSFPFSSVGFFFLKKMANSIMI